MKIEEFRRSIPSNDVTPLPKSEAKPCMRGVLDLELYNRTGKVKMIEPLEVYVPPIQLDDEVTVKAEAMKRRRPIIMSNKPSREALETDLRSGLPIAIIAKKYDYSVATVHNWIRSYGLAGIQGVKKPEVEEHAVEEKREPILEDMVQESPTPAEIEQFHTDEPVQELPNVEMDPSGMTEEENMSDEEYDRIMATVEVLTVEPIVADAEMNIYTCLDCGFKFFSEEYSSLCNACNESLQEREPITEEPDPSSMGACEEVLQGVLDDLKSVRRVYLAEAEKAFDERLRGLFLEVAG